MPELELAVMVGDLLGDVADVPAGDGGVVARRADLVVVTATSERLVVAIEGAVGGMPAPRGGAPVGVSRPVTDRAPLGLDEARALLEASRGERLGGIIWLGLLCGLRPGESRALAVDDVDLVAATVTVRRQMTNEGAIGPTKTEGSVRSLRMPDELVELLAAHLDRP